ncbi:endo-1,3(4)-beta-glucanase-like protein [Heliocybe sulcata]|uniref:Endo-1,3(4)-beta-glucanase-like protein n=1 Tax=Heliocybe sulcata TaxID=5364 RepID=A0A5C3MZ03_9AGAM|nr:endo-1,3(4)-beta-glucanase-like protein [Heliocybe sulcata]
MMLPLAFLAFASTLVHASGLYYLSDYHVGYEFYNTFEFQAIPDPTHGRVNYVNESYAISKNLSYASWDTFIMRADHTTVLNASDAGRDSVRIQSYKSYTTHVIIFDIRHMPQGCATWPAAWETGSNWPYDGEVDIVEGVNDVSPNQMTLHTAPGCTMPAGNRTETGIIETTDCDAYDNSNAGCGVAAPTANSYGPAFNADGGGWYAMERTNSSIKVWFWARNDRSVPVDVSLPIASPLVDTNLWGTPTAYFPNNTDCDLASHFNENKIIINLTLCGDWAGNVFNLDGCPGDCVSYVDENPADFIEAYWDLASVRVYE